MKETMEVERRRRFWQQPFRLLQPNLRKCDARGIDASAIVQEAADMGANAILVNAGGNRSLVQERAERAERK